MGCDSLLAFVGKCPGKFSGGGISGEFSEGKMSGGVWGNLQGRLTFHRGMSRGTF